jgi:hypothetical protein
MSITDIILRVETYLPLVTKGSDLTPEEMDVNFREIYKALVDSAEFESIDRAIVTNKFSYTLTDKIKLSLVNITAGDDLERVENTGTGVALLLIRNGTGATININESVYVTLGADAIELSNNESELFLQIDTKTYLIGKSGILTNVQNGDISFTDIDEVASASNEGKIRYRKYTSAPYDYSVMEMCMLVGVATYSWVVIKENSWS